MDQWRNGSQVKNQTTEFYGVVYIWAERLKRRKTIEWCTIPFAQKMFKYIYYIYTHSHI